MRPTLDSSSQFLDPASRACLARTRSAVLNVLIAVGLTIAASGWLLRMRAGAAGPQPAGTLHDRLMLLLLALGVTSYLSGRLMGRRAALSDPSRRESLFFWSHVVPALIAALSAPLGLLYGWLIRPRLDAVIPFWIVPLALGLLSLPRATELADFERPMPESGASPR
jgi:hypothetical protein